MLFRDKAKFSVTDGELCGASYISCGRSELVSDSFACLLSFAVITCTQQKNISFYEFGMTSYLITTILSKMNLVEFVLIVNLSIHYL